MWAGAAGPDMAVWAWDVSVVRDKVGVYFVGVFVGVVLESGAPASGEGVAGRRVVGCFWWVGGGDGDMGLDDGGDTAFPAVGIVVLVLLWCPFGVA